MKLTRTSLFQKAVQAIKFSNFLKKTVNESDVHHIIPILQSDPAQRTEEEVTLLMEFMEGFNYFVKIKAKYNNEFFRELCRQLYHAKHEANKSISIQRSVFIIISGRVQVEYENESLRGRANNEQEQNESKASELTFGQSFNEFGLSDIQRCSAVAIRDSEFACLDFKVIMDLNTNLRVSDNQEKVAFQKQVSFLHLFSENEMKYLSYHMETIKYLKNQVIFFEGDSNCQHIYILKSGDVSVHKSRVPLSKLNEGEIFGEEGFLNYEARQFGVKCCGDSCVVYKINKDELEKRLWQEELRLMLFTFISQKWIFRLQRFQQLSNNKVDQADIAQHLRALNALFVPSQTFQLDERFMEVEAPFRQPAAVEVTEKQMGISNIIINMKRARTVLKDLMADDSKHKNSESQPKLADAYPKFTVETGKKNLKLSRSPKVSQKMISSNYNFITSPSKTTLVNQLNNFLKGERIQDADIDWGDDGTKTDRERKINHFYTVLENYSKNVHYQNQNLMEASSSKAKQLNKEYAELVTEQKKNIRSAFAMESKSKSDNQLRKEYFLKQLKKMQKRLQVLQMIKKGQLVCKHNQYVNEEGEIVEHQVDPQEDEHYEVVNGKRQPRFNFVTAQFYQKQPKKHKDFDTLISEQKEQIHQVKEIVSGKLTLDDAPQLNEEFLKSTSKFRRPFITTPTVVTNFTKKLRITSASFKSEMGTFHSNQPMSVKHLHSH